ncbi:hypothetical protein TrVFT333_010046 [Trichoderma virens FT-333]|nr:hypothetical protein TrVFT333_010046 [Trichoderma virens FT-333]
MLCSSLVRPSNRGDDGPMERSSADCAVITAAAAAATAAFESAFAADAIPIKTATVQSPDYMRLCSALAPTAGATGIA